MIFAHSNVPPFVSKQLIQRLVTSGTFELDGGSWDVDNNIWLVGDDTDVVVFDALSQEQLTSIVDIQIDELARRLSARRLELDVDDAARVWLAERGYDPAYGARPLRRLVQQAIGDQLARKLLAGEIHDGDTVHVGHSGDEDGLVLY